MKYFEKAKLIDGFVEFLIREECQGCTECEPRLPADWKPNFACISEGYAKHFMDCGERFLKAEREEEDV